MARESGWGQGQADFVAAACAEEADYAAFVREFCPDERLKAYLLLGYDFRNLEAFYRAKRFGLKAEKMLAPEGVVERSVIERALEEGKLGELPAAMEQAVTDCDDLIAAGKADGVSVGTAFLRAYYAELVRIVPKKLREGLRYRIDTLNLSTAVRARSAQAVEKMFLDGGTVPSDEVASIALAPEKLTTAYACTTLDEYAAALAEAVQNGEPLYRAEQIAESREYAMLAEDLFSLDGYLPFYAYCRKKLLEIRNVRIVITALAAGQTRSEITPQLRLVV